jgi:hypothetical protein
MGCGKESDQGVENPYMISEVSFATQHTSLWHVLAPNSERFVRRINLNIDRYGVDHPFLDSPNRRGFLNESAFQLVKLRQYEPAASIADAVSIAKKNLASLDRPQSGNLSDPSESEVESILAMEESLKGFVKWQSKEGSTIVFEPTFPGCGFLNASVGDLLIEDTLYEVKAGDRLFRSTDLRQLMTYCAMNFAAKKYLIRKAGFINPRRGTYFILDIETIAHEMAGKSSPELFSEIVYYLSNSGVSR